MKITVWKETLSSYLTAACLLCVYAIQSHGAVIYSENFDSFDVSSGPIILTAGSPAPFGSRGVGTDDVTMLTNAGDLFGLGNVYLSHAEVASGGSNFEQSDTISGLGGGGVAQLSFKFYEPSSAPVGASAGIVVVLHDGTNSSTTNVRTANVEFKDFVEDGIDDPATSSISFQSSGMPAVPFLRDQVHEITLIANYSLITDATPIFYMSGTKSVPGESFDVWLDGTLVANDVPFRSNANGNHIDDADRFAIRGSSTSSTFGTILIDDIVLRDDITFVPEPSTIALLGLSALSVVILGLRKNRKAVI